MHDALAQQLNARFAQLDALSRLKLLRAALPGRIVFTTSLGLEDQVLTHLIAETGLDIALVTLDTGRLFPETYDLWAKTEARYKQRIEAHMPERVAVEGLITAHGINGFRETAAQRKICCAVRKLEPLSRALSGASGWIAGLRAEQSAERADAVFVEQDVGRGLVKANPLLDWTREQTAAFAAKHNVPINRLHAAGYLSIGCAPCTRAVSPGEPERAGRWWWENEAQKECGLHVGADGRFIRKARALEATP